MQAKKLTL